MTTYWLSDSCALLNSLNIIPFGNEDFNEDYNSLTRLIILTTVVVAFLRPDDYAQIFLTGIVSVCITVLFYFMNSNLNIKDTKRYVQPELKVEKKEVKKSIEEVNGNQFEKSIKRFNEQAVTAYKKEGLKSGIEFTSLFKIKK
jgi:hypothetical protein